MKEKDWNLCYKLPFFFCPSVFNLDLDTFECITYEGAPVSMISMVAVQSQWLVWLLSSLNDYYGCYAC